MTVVQVVLWKMCGATLFGVVAAITSRARSHVVLAYAAWTAVLVLLLMPPLGILRVAYERSATSSLMSYAERLQSLLEKLLSSPTVLAALPFLYLSWVLGSCILLVRYWATHASIARLVRHAKPSSECLQERCQQLAEHLQLRQSPLIVVADGRFSPFLWNPIGRPPCIVLPEGLVNRLSKHAAESVLVHELVHLRRRDVCRRYLEMATTVVWWWLPLSWMARIRLRALEELCIDDEVVRLFPAIRLQYARTLLDTDEFLSSEGRTSGHSLNMAFAQSECLKERIHRLVETPRPRQQGHVPMRWLLAAATILIGFTGVSFTHSGPAVCTHVAFFPVVDWELPAEATDELILPSPQPNQRPLRLLRLNSDGTPTQRWQIADSHPAVADTPPESMDWIFEHLGSEDVVIDQDGVSHSHPMARVENVAERSSSDA